jgi:hypothetical protein
MSELWLLAVIPALAWLLAKHRMSRALTKAESLVQEGPIGVSAEEMGQVVQELSMGLNPPSRVTSPTFSMESSHVWSSPSGKRVYMN